MTLHLPPPVLTTPVSPILQVLPPVVLRQPPPPVLTTVHLAPHPAPVIGLGYTRAAAAPPYMTVGAAGHPPGMQLQPLGHGIGLGPGPGYPRGPPVDPTLPPGNPYGTNRPYRGGQLTRGGPRLR